MRNDFYPDGSVRNLLNTGLVDPNTSKVLESRLNQDAVVIPRYLSKKNFDTLQAVCSRLIPQPSRDYLVDLIGSLEDQLIKNTGDGWRYAVMPEDNQVIINGLVGIEQTSDLLFDQAFSTLDSSRQDEILAAIQNGTSTAPTFKLFSSSLFFEEILTRLVEIYYSHPLGKEEIGDTSFADAVGWQNIGLNELEAYETKSLNAPHDE